MHKATGGGVTALAVAADWGNTEIFFMLLQNGALANNTNSCYLGKLLRVAAGGGSVEVVRALIAKGADVNFQATDGSTPLMKALSGDQKTDVVKVLLDNGADVNLTTRDGTTPLRRAILCGHRKVADMLIQHGGQEAGPTRQVTNNASERH